MAERPIFDFRARNGRTAMQLVRSRRQPLRERAVTCAIRLTAIGFSVGAWLIFFSWLAKAIA